MFDRKPPLLQEEAFSLFPLAGIPAYLCTMKSTVRVRFAPSPTGGLHLGGVRTALFNYLFAKKQGGSFVLRIEDTDQTRFVPGAEQYILDCLEWCGISPDEGPHQPGPYGPYRQSERKPIYRKFAEQLIQQGHAYYAFDTPEELESMRERFKSESTPSPQYNAALRGSMRNSLTLDPTEVNRLLSAGTPHVIRIHVPVGKKLVLNDMIRGEVEFDTSEVDDKVLLKADGMPTYHLAVVVDDYHMKITHAFRGEEWLPSAPVHLLLWEYLGWKQAMPLWAHLPLILKPDGHGKLSKRDGDRLGFPVFAMDWYDPRTQELTRGFKEMGFLPEAFINMLALLGWNDGSGEEVLDRSQLCERFSIERVHKGGARFDFEKAKWFNQEWIKRKENIELLPSVEQLLVQEGLSASAEQLVVLIGLVKERCQTLKDFIPQLDYFFKDPVSMDWNSISSKWDSKKNVFFEEWVKQLSELSEWTAVAIENSFKQVAGEQGIKPGDVQLPLRIMLVGGKFGPPVFIIAQYLHKDVTLKRITSALTVLNHAAAS